MERRITIGFEENVTPEASAWCLGALGVWLVWATWNFSRLALFWSDKPEYTFAWVVPLGCGVLFWQRWSTRSEAWPADPFGFATGLFVIGIPYGFLLWLGGASPDWMLPPILVGLLTCLVPLLIVWRAGGGGWIYDFFSPLVLLLALLPWPLSVEHFFTHNLGVSLAEVAAELWNLQGIAAVPQEVEIEKANHVIRALDFFYDYSSLPAFIAFAWFLGAVLQLNWTRRVLLVAGLFPLFWLISLLEVMGYMPSLVGLFTGLVLLSGMAGLLSLKPVEIGEKPLHDGVEVLRPKCYPPELKWQNFCGVILAVVMIEGGVYGWYSLGTGMNQGAGWKPREGLLDPRGAVGLEGSSGSFLSSLRESDGVWLKQWSETDGARWSACYAEKNAGFHSKSWMNQLRPQLFWNARMKLAPKDMGLWKLTSPEGRVVGRVFHYPGILSGTWIFYTVWPRVPAELSEEETMQDIRWEERWTDAVERRRDVQVRLLRVQVEELRTQRDFRMELEGVLARELTWGK